MTRRSWPFHALFRKFVWEKRSNRTPILNGVAFSRPCGDRIDLKIGTHIHTRNVYDPMRPDFWFINFLPFLESFKMKFEKMCSKLTPPVPLNQGRVQTGPDGAGYLEPSLSKTGGSKNALNCSSRVGWTSKKILRISWKHAPYFIISLV